MASIDDSSLIFFSKATPIQWTFVLNLYKDVFKLHAEKTRGSKKNGPAELIKLDIWFQEQLPQLIRSRKEHQLFYDDLIQITKWKLLRGKFRPSLLDLVKTNTETAVKNVTKKAFRKMPNISQAINALTQLKGIGLATASAVLVAYSPDVCPFAADESMIATPGVENSDYTCAEYMNYVEKVQILVDKLRKIDPDSDWTPHKVELAMWTHYQIKKYNLTHLDNMPLEIVSNSVQETNNEESNGLNKEEVRSKSINDEQCNQVINGNEDNQVDSSDTKEIDLNSNSNSNLVDSNSNLVDSNSNLMDNNYESSSRIFSNGLSENVTQSDSESVSNGLSLNLINKNLDEDVSNLSSAISSNSIDDQSYESSSLQLNKATQSIQEEDLSNNVSSTNGISQSTSSYHQTMTGSNYKLDNLITSNESDGKEESTNESNIQLNSNLVNSSLIKQHLITSNNSQDNLSQTNTTNDSFEKFSTISSSCENSNNINSSEDSIQLLNKKRSNSSTSSSLSNLTKQPTSRTLKNCNEVLDLNVLDDNAVPFDSSDSEPLSKRQKLIN